MKIQNVQTESGYGLVVKGADVNISYNDALFMYHALHALRANMEKLSQEVYQATDNELPRNLCDETGQILQTMDRLLMPIATEIVVPKTEVNLFTYETDTDKLGKEERRKYPKYKGEPEAVPVQG